MKPVFRLLLCLPLALPLAAMGGMRSLTNLNQRPTESEEHHSGGETLSVIASGSRRCNEIATVRQDGPTATSLTARRPGTSAAAGQFIARMRGHCLANGLRAPLLT